MQGQLKEAYAHLRGAKILIQWDRMPLIFNVSSVEIGAAYNCLSFVSREVNHTLIFELFVFFSTFLPFFLKTEPHKKNEKDHTYCSYVSAE